jgi:hypothetical protein
MGIGRAVDLVQETMRPGLTRELAAVPSLLGPEETVAVLASCARWIRPILLVITNERLVLSRYRLTSDRAAVFRSVHWRQVWTVEPQVSGFSEGAVLLETNRGPLKLRGLESPEAAEAVAAAIGEHILPEERREAYSLAGRIRSQSLHGLSRAWRFYAG